MEVNATYDGGTAPQVAQWGVVMEPGARGVWGGQGCEYGRKAARPLTAYQCTMQGDKAVSENARLHDHSLPTSAPKLRVADQACACQPEQARAAALHKLFPRHGHWLKIKRRSPAEDQPAHCCKQLHLLPCGQQLIHVLLHMGCQLLGMCVQRSWRERMPAMAMSGSSEAVVAL